MNTYMMVVDNLIIGHVEKLLHVNFFLYMFAYYVSRV